MRLDSLAERRGVWWAAAVVLAVASAAVVVRATGDADAARRRWGSTRAVAVAVAPIDAGIAIDASAVAVRDVPAGLVPDGALGTVPDGRVALAPIVAGEVLVEARLAPAGLSGPAALVPPGWRAIAVPSGAGPGPPPLAVGDRVDIFATFLAEAGTEPPTVAVAEDALVVAVDDEGVTVAVPEVDAARVAFATTAGAVTLALRGPD